MMAIDVEGLHFAHDPLHHVLRGISLQVADGEILDILGPNGAGKSTLLRCLLGIETRWRGRIRVRGEDARAMSRRRTSRLLSYVPQTARTSFSFSVEQSVMMGRVPRLALNESPGASDRAAVERALAQVGLERLAHRSILELSGGERQLVVFARALAQDTPIILFDEPTASLDLANQGRVLRIMRDLARTGRTIIMTSHVPEHAFLLGGRVALIKDGKILASGDPPTVCTESLLATLYQAPVRLLSVNEQGAGPIAACVPVL